MSLNSVSHFGSGAWMSSLLTLAGMLSSAETIDVIAETLQTHRVPSIVLDPVIRFQRDA